MRRVVTLIIFISAIFSFAPLAHAAPLPLPSAKDPNQPPDVPPNLDFVHSLDMEMYLERMNDRGIGAQSFRLRTRYLDPDVNAFVGFVTGIHHFNIDMRIGDPNAPDTADVFWNGGIDVGIVRGRSIWEVDIMGTVLSASAGPAFALVGEHAITKRLGWYHRLEVNAYLGDHDTVIDADQGMVWQRKNWGVTAGYRIFASEHMSRSGPRLGIRYRFENPKIPFIFPSLG